MTKPALTTAMTVRELERQLRASGMGKRMAQKKISRLSKNGLLDAACKPIQSTAFSS